MLNSEIFTTLMVSEIQFNFTGEKKSTQKALLSCSAALNHIKGSLSLGCVFPNCRGSGDKGLLGIGALISVNRSSGWCWSAPLNPSLIAVSKIRNDLWTFAYKETDMVGYINRISCQLVGFSAILERFEFTQATQSLLCPGISGFPYRPEVLFWIISSSRTPI